MPRYNPAEIEPRWQRYWDDNKTFKTPEDVTSDKVYVLDMFPYPSGDGLHVGHPEGYTATDIVCRYCRAVGKSVLHPMGFDAFGLPAEEHAIKTNTPPRESTERNIGNFRRQLKMLGFSYDWDRELATTDVEYFRWTQWIFLVLFDTWFDPETKMGRPISELPIPEDVIEQGLDAIAIYQDEFRLAYQAEALVNWCPGLGTVLANEEVIDGLSERGDHPVQRIPLKQWTLRITAYADRLEDDLQEVDWPEGIKKLQRDWIGRSTGAEVDFYIGEDSEFDSWKRNRVTTGFPRKPQASELRIYTTRPDTLFGVTYMVISPEHPDLQRLTRPEQEKEVHDYCEAAANKSDRDRQDEKRSKTGVFTGSYAINPLNDERVPVWVADYVLISYGTGAIMAVAAHDTRDYEFAKKYDLKVTPVINPPGDATVDRDQLLRGDVCFVGRGTAINSDKYDGQDTDAFKRNVIADLSRDGIGREAVNYKLRDWLFSRQRFWGEPFPILHELDDDGVPTGVIRAVDEQSLPVDLPHIEDYKPHGRPEPPLEKAADAWLYPMIDGKRYKRETNTMPQWAGSCWYYLRFIDPKNSERLVDPELEKLWMPVDLYIGGAEHAVLHLLYARFWHKVLFDRGHLTTSEPFKKLVNQGMILGEMEFTGYRDSSEQWVSCQELAFDEENKPICFTSKKPLHIVKLEADQVEKKGDQFVLKSDATIAIDSRAFKMSKSRGNVINPDAIVAEYGADSLRLYEMFMGPLEQAKPWSMAGVNGVKNFLDRVWRMIVDEGADERTLNPAVVDVKPTDEQLRILHKTIKAVEKDIQTLSFNTAIARMMEFVNFFTKQSQRPTAVMKPFLIVLSPFAPHLAEELWQALGHEDSLAYGPWPQYDEALTIDQSIEIPIQINGKVKTKVQIRRGMTQEELTEMALADDKIATLLEGKTVRKVIAVPDRLVNIVAQ